MAKTTVRKTGAFQKFNLGLKAERCEMYFNSFYKYVTNFKKNEIYVKSSSRHTWRLRAQGTGSIGFSLFPVFLASSPALLIIDIQFILYCLMFFNSN